MHYSQLTIHQKINIKSKVGFHHVKSVIERIVVRDPLCYGSPAMPWRPEVRNFDLGWNQSYH